MLDSEPYMPHPTVRAAVAGLLCLASSAGAADRVVSLELIHAQQQLAAAGTRAGVAAAPVQPSGQASLASLSPAVSAVIPTFDAGRAPFSLSFNGIDSPYATMSAFVLPAATLDIAAGGGTGVFAGSASGGRLVAAGPSSWRWTAPGAHGDHEIRISDTKSGAAARLHVFVLQPYDGGGYVGNYRLGHYHAEAKDGDPAYGRPRGFVEVTAANVNTMLSPHFRLGQFLCKDTGELPKYVAFSPALLVKLENLLEMLAKRGLPAETLHVMSGYRTPAYNAGIGNETTWSRHTYGDAADVFLDRDGDGMQDDLDHDGRSTREDARILYRLVEDVLDEKLPEQMAGGLSAYGPTDAHGPFVHIDTRGKRARW